MIQCSCPKCGYYYKVAEDLAGNSVLCPECKMRFTVKGKPQRPKHRDEDDRDEDNDSPRRREEEDQDEQPSKAGGIPAWVWIVGAAAVLLLLCGGSVVGIIALASVGMASVAQNTPPPAQNGPAPGQQLPPGGDNQKNQPVPDVKPTWETVGNSGKIGDVTVQCRRVVTYSFQAKFFGEWKNCGPLLIIELMLTNSSPNRIVQLEGWQDASTDVEDEHGNRYGLSDFGLGFDGFGDGIWSEWNQNNQVDASKIIAYNLSLHPGKTYVTYLFCAKPADVSKEVRIMLQSNKLRGGKGTLRLKAPLTR